MSLSAAELLVLIRLQATGQAQLDALNGQIGKLGLATVGAGIGLAALYEVGKSALDNYEAQQSATKNLSQAFATQGEKVPTKQIKSFLDTNKDFISDTYDAEQAIASATRAGLNWSDTQLLMQDALDLSIDRGISMSDAMDTLVKAAAGGRAQLAYLGITSTQLSASTNDLANQQKAAARADDEKAKADRALAEGIERLREKHKVTKADLMHLADLKAKDFKATQDDATAHQKLADAQKSGNAQSDRAVHLHDLLHPKLAKERDTLTDLQLHQRYLNTDWQDFTAQIGPGVSNAIDDVTRAADTAVGILTVLDDLLAKMGNDASVFDQVMTAILGHIPGGVVPLGLMHMPANQTHHQGPTSSRLSQSARSGDAVNVNVKVSLSPGLIAKHVSAGQRT